MSEPYIGVYKVILGHRTYQCLTITCLETIQWIQKSLNEQGCQYLVHPEHPRAVSCYSESFNHSGWNRPLEDSGPTLVHSRLLKAVFSQVFNTSKVVHWASLPVSEHSHCELFFHL